jgi:hypothetical protein
MVMQAADLTTGPVPGTADDSAVVFVSCVLEYVSDPEAALRELDRMAGSPGNLFLVFVEPWSLTAALYPGARWARGVDEHQISMKPVTTPRKIATLCGLAGLLALALWPHRNNGQIRGGQSPRRDTATGCLAQTARPWHCWTTSWHRARLALSRHSGRSRTIFEGRSESVTRAPRCSPPRSAAANCRSVHHFSGAQCCARS